MIFPEREKDHSDLSSRVRVRAQQQPLLIKNKSGGSRASASGEAREKKGQRFKTPKEARRTQQPLEAFLDEYAGEEARDDAKRPSGANWGLGEAIDADEARRLELQASARELLENPKLPLDAFVAASFAAYKRSITPGAAGGLASHLLNKIRDDRAVRDYVVERLIEHDSGEAADRYGDKGVVSFMMRDAPRWQAERFIREAQIASVGKVPTPESLPRLELEPAQEERAQLTQEQIEHVTERLRLHHPKS